MFCWDKTIHGQTNSHHSQELQLAVLKCCSFILTSPSRMTIRYSELIFDSLSCQIVEYNDLICLRLQDDSHTSAIIFRYGKTFLYLPPSQGEFKPYILNRAIYHTTPSQRASRQNLENKGFIFHAMHRWKPLMLMSPHRWIAPALCMRVIPNCFFKDF